MSSIKVVYTDRNTPLIRVLKYLSDMSIRNTSVTVMGIRNIICSNDILQKFPENICAGVILFTIYVCRLYVALLWKITPLKIIKTY